MEENSEEGPAKGTRVVSQLITHINQLEQKISALEDMLSEYNDIQLVSKLDVINLKNEIDKLKLTTPSISEEQVAQLQELAKIFEKSSAKDMAHLSKRLESMSKELEKLGQRMAGVEYPSSEVMSELDYVKSHMDSGGAGQAAQLNLKKLETEVSEIRRDLRGLKKIAPGPGIKPSGGAKSLPMKGDGRLLSMKSDIKELDAQLKKNSSDLKRLESSMEKSRAHAPISIVPGENLLKSRLDKMQRDIESLSRRPGNAAGRGKAGKEEPFKKAFSDLSGEIRKLNAEVGRLKSPGSRKPAESGQDIARVEKSQAEMRKELLKEIHDSRRETVAYMLKELKRLMS